MKVNVDEARDRENATPAGTPRYEPPAIEWQETLQAVARFAAACSKTPAGDPQCSEGSALSS